MRGKGKGTFRKTADVEVEEAMFRVVTGSLIRRAREKSGKTQEQIATACFLSRPAIVNIEKGKQDITLCFATQIASAIGCKLEAIIPKGTAKWEEER